MERLYVCGTGKALQTAAQRNSLHASFVNGVSEMANAKILIVEDDQPLAEVLEYNLRQDGYEALVANNGRAGLEQARLHAPNLIVLDVMLPMIDGLEICRRLRADSATRDILVLMLTAKAEETDEIVLCSRCG
jgi:DNA-binding response OmpR family regulator